MVEVLVDEKYSTTKLLLKESPIIENSLEDKFETFLFLPERKSRKGEGGLRTKGYFKKSYDDKPLISIITVVFNGEQYLEQTIQSVINQTYDNIEYVIIDGGSTDGTLDIIKKYEDKIDYWASELDEGIYYAMNKGVQAATGEFIAFINADDWYEKDAIDCVINAVIKDQNIDFLYGDLNIISQKREVTLWKGNRGVKGVEIPHPTCFIRSSILKQAPFDTKFKIASDAELILRLLSSNIKSLYINRVIANFRAGGVSSVFWETRKETFFIQRKYIGLKYAIKSFLKNGAGRLRRKLLSVIK